MGSHTHRPRTPSASTPTNEGLGLSQAVCTRQRIGNAPMRRLPSRGKTSPDTTCANCFPWRSAWHTPPRLVAADASLFAWVWCQLCGRRTTTHQAQGLVPSRPQARRLPLAPARAPENHRFPAVSHRRLRTEVASRSWDSCWACPVFLGSLLHALVAEP